MRMAEREGFEPSVRLPALRFSRPAYSTTLAPLHRNTSHQGARAKGPKPALVQVHREEIANVERPRNGFSRHSPLTIL
jgi:hypothetical protein